MHRYDQVINQLKTNSENQKYTILKHDKVIESIEKNICNVFYETTHSESMRISDVISHIEQVSESAGIDEKQEIIDMLKMLNEFKAYLIKIKTGCIGERIAEDFLKEIAINNIRLSNIELTCDCDTEIDQLVITNKGIFIVEVKHYTNDMIILKSGNFVNAYNRKVTYNTINISEKMSIKKRAVLNIVTDEISSFNYSNFKKSIHSVILWTNKYSNLTCYDKYLKICYNHDIAEYIEDYPSENVFTDEEIQRIAEVIESNKTEKEYSIDFDLDKLYDHVARGVVILEEARAMQFKELEQNQPIQKEQEVNEPTEENHKFDFQSFVGGSFFALATLGLGTLTYKLVKKYA